MTVLGAGIEAHEAEGERAQPGLGIARSGRGFGGVDKILEWKSSKPDVATVDSASATVTGVAPGTTTITASAGTKRASEVVSLSP